jgi:4-hydroxy-2-oxoheptanedioate aldolase
MTAAEFARKIRAHESAVGYWIVLDSPASTERIAGLGYDYVCLDGQHGLLGYSGLLNGLTAIDARGGSAGMVRVEANNPTAIGRALDAGAVGVIVPLVDTAELAAAAVAAAKYAPLGIRSYGPTRSGLRIGPTPAEANETTLVFAMIETAAGLANVAEICATPGLDGVYVGPSDLSLAVGGAFPGDPAIATVFDAAVVTVQAAAAAAGIAAGIHTPSGEVAAQRFAQGYTFATISADIGHLEQAATAHLKAAKAAASTDRPDDMQTVAGLVQRLRTAMIESDTAALRELVAGELSYGHSSGRVEGKDEFVGGFESGKAAFLTIELSGETVAVVGDAAIVRHAMTADTNGDGKPGSVNITVLMVWQRRDGAWKLVARQAVKA